MKTKTKFLKELLILFGVMTGALALFNMVPTAAAAGLISQGDNLEAISTATGGETSLRTLIQRMINFALGFLGLFAVIMVIYGGFTYVSSAGNEEAVGNAKKIILYSVVGIIVILLSFVIINTVLGIGIQGGQTQ